jgi:excinuclease ABC subunit B
VIFYADSVTGSMEEAIVEMKRRREIQTAFNEKNGIVPQGIKKSIPDALYHVSESDYVTIGVEESAKEVPSQDSLTDAEIRARMVEAAEALDFEKAAYFRDLLRGRGEKPSGEGIEISPRRGKSKKGLSGDSAKKR